MSSKKLTFPWDASILDDNTKRFRTVDTKGCFYIKSSIILKETVEEEASFWVAHKGNYWVVSYLSIEIFTNFNNFFFTIQTKVELRIDLWWIDFSSSEFIFHQEIIQMERFLINIIKNALNQQTAAFQAFLRNSMSYWNAISSLLPLQKYSQLHFQFNV